MRDGSKLAAALRAARPGAGLRAACVAACLSAAFLAVPAMAQDALRPAVGNPLAKAKSLMATKNYSGALAQVAIADRQKNKTANENFVIQEMRGAIAQASGDTASASHIFADLINSGRLSGAGLTQMLMAETSLAYQQKDYPATITWADKYFRSGGKEPSIRTLVIQAYYLQKDYANAAKYQLAQIAEEIKAKKVPPEDQLQLLAAAQKQTGDHAGLTSTMSQLVTYYPKDSYWADMIYSVQTSTGFSDRLELDLDRFKLRTNTLTREQDFMQMAQLALGDNDPGSAVGVIAEAKERHVFGQPAQAAREQRLEALAQKSEADVKAKLDSSDKDLEASAASTSQQYFDLGQQFVSAKQYDKGVKLMREAIAKGGLRRPALAQLRLGEALVDAGDKQAATAALQAVPQMTDGTSDIARLWLLWLRSQKTLAANPR